MILLTTIAFVLTLLYIYFKRKFNYWNVRNVPNLNPKTPLGDLVSCLLEWKSIYDLMIDSYRYFKVKGHKYFGFYFTVGPVFMPIDLDLIKRILSIDYEYFTDRGSDYDIKKIPLSDNMFCAKQERWKYLKDKLVTVFTPNKLRNVQPIIEIYLKDVCKCIDDNINTPINVLNIAQRYTLDVACNFYLGLDEKNILENKSPIIKFAQDINTSTYKNLFKTAFTYGTGNPCNLFTALIINNEMYNFLYDYTKKAVDLRKRSKTQRKDALNDYLEVHEKDGKNFNFQAFVCQVFVTVSATFETSSSIMSYLLYEIAKNPNYQNQLKIEIKDLYEKNYGNVTFDMINDLDFLHRMLIETLRLHPVFGAVTRECVKDYKIPDSDVVIEKGTKIMVPIIALHNDPDVFENPEEFNPDRYVGNDLEQNVLAFSMGQKQCPGKRLAMILIKNFIVTLMSNYELKLNPKTGSKLEKVIFTKHLLFKYKNTIWVDFYKKPLFEKNMQ